MSRLGKDSIARLRKAAEMTTHASFGDEGGPPMPFDIIPCADIVAVLDLLEMQTSISGTLAQHLADTTQELEETPWAYDAKLEAECAARWVEQCIRFHEQATRDLEDARIRQNKALHELAKLADRFRALAEPSAPPGETTDG